MKARLIAAALFGVTACGDDAVPAPTPPTVRSYHGALSIELRGTADVTLTATGSETVDVQLALRDVDTRGLLDTAAPLLGPGLREPFPETRSELFTATFAAPASAADSPCSGSPVTLALALHRREPNLRVGGSLTAYCGTEARGIPARVMRLSGNLAAK